MKQKIVTQIRANDYDKLKKFDEIELVVVATNREPMKVFASRYPLEANKPGYIGYENAVFNGEV